MRQDLLKYKKIRLNMFVFKTTNKFLETGFTLLEVMIAISFITVGIGGAFAVIQKNFTIISVAGSQLTAAYLAQEGVEIVKNIRDTNWIKKNNWDQGIDIESDYEADYDDISLTAYNGEYLNLNEQGLYGYSPGTATKFKRKITITDKTADSLKITVKVIWEEKGREHNFKVQTLLYNWK